MCFHLITAHALCLSPPSVHVILTPHGLVAYLRETTGASSLVLLQQSMFIRFLIVSTAVVSPRPKTFPLVRENIPIDRRWYSDRAVERNCLRGEIEWGLESTELM